MINTRMSIILQELLGVSEPITSEYLAKVLNVTSRTVRNDIKALEEIIKNHGATIESMRGSGYLLKIDDQQKFRKFLSEITEDTTHDKHVIPSFPEDRIRYIIRRLLLADHYIKLEDLADELYVSRSTVQNDFKTVRDIFQSHGIQIVTKPNYGIKIKGDEKKLRFFVSEYIFSRREYDIEQLNSQLSILPNDKLKVIQNIILEKLSDHGIVMPDIALNNLIIHIAIACARIKNKNYVSMGQQEIAEIIQQKEYQTAVNIVSAVEEKLHVKFPETEVAYVTIHLMGNRLFNEEPVDEKEIEPFIDPELKELTKEILERIDQKMQLGIQHDKKLAINLVLHLKPAINRHRFGMNLRNPMLDAIKTNYPIAFEAGVIASTVIQERLGIKINENEIGYLAVHFGAAIERKKSQIPRKRCVIVCASGAGSAQLLYYKIQEKFHSKLDIIDTTGYYQLKSIPLEEIDLIISTIPIRERLGVPVIEVNTILGENDFAKIERYLSFTGENPIVQYTREDLVFLQKSLKTKEEVISFLCRELEKKGMVTKHFYQSVMERESIAPTCFGNLVAIPHPMVPQTEETFWAICTLEKPIIWFDKRVQFVCLLSVQKNNTKNLQEMYKILTKVLDNPSVVQQLVKAKTYDEIIKVFYDEYVKE